MPFHIDDKNTLIQMKQNPHLIYENEIVRVNKNTGLLRTHMNYSYEAYLIKIEHTADGIPKQALFIGSIHKQSNNGLHNADHLTYQNFVTAVNKLCLDLNVHPSICMLRPFEYGLNIEIPWDFKDLIYNIFFHRRKEFRLPMHNVRLVRCGGSKNNYEVKVYAKSEQYPEYCTGKVLRVEIHENRMRELNKKGISRLSDLLVLENHLKLRDVFLDRLQQVVFFDYTINNNVPDDLLPIIDQYKNQNFWRDLVFQDSLDNGRRYNYNLQKLNMLSKKFGSSIWSCILDMLDVQYISNLNLSTDVKLTA